MLRVTVELHPFGMDAHKKTLRTLHIVNTGKGTKTNGNYSAVFIGEKGKVYKRIEILNFKRKQKGPWQLVYQALRTFEGRGKHR